MWAIKFEARYTTMKSKIFEKTVLAGLVGLLLLTSCKNEIYDTAYCDTKIDSSAPDWIKKNFICVTVTVSDSNITMYTTGEPPYPSYYYGTSSNLYEDMPAGNTANNNSIGAQNIYLTFPTDPVDLGSGNGPATPGGVAGIAANGVIIFDNAAAPGDTLADEAVSFDQSTGHPAGTLYHYHVEPTRISNNDGNIVGVGYDGVPIYGQKESDGSDVSVAISSDDHAHTHSTNDFTGDRLHYHVMQDTTAGIVTILGDKYRAALGTLVQ